MIHAPSISPTFVKRRFTPWKRSNPAAIFSSGIPSSIAAAIAASAFWTLWRPGIGSRMPWIGKRGKPVRHDPPVTDPADQRLHFGVVDAQHCEAVERDVLNKLAVRFLDL